MKITIMKIHQMIYTAAALLMLGACSHEEIEVYNADNNGVYFNYDSESQLTTTVNFAEHVLGNPETLPVTLNLKVMGLKADSDRQVILKSRPVEGSGELQVTCPVIVFTPDTIEKEVTVMIARPEVRDSDYAAVVYIDSQDPQSQIGAGITGYQEYVIHANETYIKPGSWNRWSMLQMYLGDWSPEKHVFLVNLTKNNLYYNSQNYNAIVNWNVMAVDSLHKWKEAHLDEAVEIDIPFIAESMFVYGKPWYWGDLQTQYLGEYNSGAFAAICSALNITTKNEYESFVTTEENMKSLNKNAVRTMMQKYNAFYYDGWRRGSSYKNYFYVPMFADMTYDLIKPAPWSDTQGGADLIKQYYGEYSPAKYEFMIKTWLSHKGSDFVLNQLFPVMNEWGYVHWDSSLGGEASIQEINQIMRNAMVGGTYDFTFPTI